MHLTKEQMAEITYLVKGHRDGVLAMLPPGKIPGQGIYDDFFRLAREIIWLKL